jgi:hypothetical protein
MAPKRQTRSSNIALANPDIPPNVPVPQERPAYKINAQKALAGLVEQSQ